MTLRCFFLDIVLSQIRYLGGFRSSRCHGSNRKNEIYNPGMVPELPELEKKYEKIGNTSWTILGHCVGTILKFERFPEVLMVPIESSWRDLQSGNGPGASGAQKNII